MRVMNWFRDNAAAIQALATLALIGITYWYVRVTRKIAKSSVEQVRLMKEAARIAQQKNVQTLGIFATRLRSNLATLDASVPRENQLRAFTLVNETDIARLEVLSSQIDSAAIAAAASASVVAIREILGPVQEVKSIHPGIGCNRTVKTAGETPLSE